MYRCSACGTAAEGVTPSPFDPAFGTGKCKRCGKKRTFVKDSAKRGGENRSEGITKVLEHEKSWSDLALDWIWNLPRGTKFTSEDMTAVLGLPDSVNAVGAVMRTAGERGWIKKGPPTTAKRPNQNSTTIFVWERV